MPWTTDIERFRVRRTLSEVKRKLEEALRLSRQHADPLRTEGEHVHPTLTHRRR
jgi:hypothetical protein